MGADDDIAAMLPEPPPPAPARREAAIAEALHRFDGGDPRGSARDKVSGSWWSGHGLQRTVGWVSAALVALVGLPVAWTYIGQPPVEPRRPEASMAYDVAPSTPEKAVVAPSVTNNSEMAAKPSPVAKPGTARQVEAHKPPAHSMIVQGQSAPAPVVMVPPMFAPPPPPAPMAEAQKDEAGRYRQQDRVSPPPGVVANVEAPSERLQSAQPKRDSQSDIMVTAMRRSSPTGTFDRAFEAEPRSSSDYLDRGLARQRKGDMAGALSDMDKAVRHDPKSARAYYLRSTVRRQKGDLRGADSDEKRAVALDPDYAEIFGK